MAQTIRKRRLLRRHTHGKTEAYRKNRKPDSQKHQKHHSQPERRRPGRHHTPGRDQTILPLSPFHPGNDAQQKTEPSGKQPGRRHQPQGIGRLFPNHLHHRTAVEKRHAKVPLKNPGQPEKKPSPGRNPHAPVGFQPLNLLLRHGTQGRLAHIAL